jgi:hypothetical protein
MYKDVARFHKDVRSSLVFSGLLSSGLGLLLYILEVPFGFSWSIPLMVGGLVFMIAGFIVSETEGRIEPPPGYRFCLFCSTPVKLDAKRCEQCNGLQPLVNELT